MTDHKTGTRQEWLAARLELLEAEKALTRRSDELARPPTEDRQATQTGTTTSRLTPRIKVEVGTQTFTVLAEEFDDTARAELWPKLLAQYPQLGEAQAKTMRQIPVFMLTRQD
jgi:hypothetical protein